LLIASMGCNGVDLPKPMTLAEQRYMAEQEKVEAKRKMTLNERINGYYSAQRDRSYFCGFKPGLLLNLNAEPGSNIPYDFQVLDTTSVEDGVRVNVKRIVRYRNGTEEYSEKTIWKKQDGLWCLDYTATGPDLVRSTGGSVMCEFGPDPSLEKK